MSQADAAACAGIETAELREVEAGVRTAEGPLVARLLSRYGSAVLRQLIPPRYPLYPGYLAGLTDGEVLRQHLDLVRAWRGLGARGEVQFRSDDLAVLVAILGTDAMEIERRLVALTGCGRSTARRFRGLLLVSVAALPLGLAGMASISMGATSAAASPAAKLPAAPVLPSAGPQAGLAPPPPALPVATAAVVAAPAPVVIPGTVSVPNEEATVSIPRLNLNLPVVEGGQSVIDEGIVAHYEGTGWLAPTPAGAMGTYWLAAHHVTHGGPFEQLPDAVVGDQVTVTTNDQRFVYTVTSIEVVGIYAGYVPVYGNDPSARRILLQTCLDGTRRLLVHGILTSG